jgi:cytochrome c-type biogenesis protein CcmH
MILFWLICALFVVIALAFVLPPLLQTSEEDDVESGRKEANIAVYRDQIAELEADLRNGVMSAEQYQQERDELERRLLEDVSTATAKTGKSTPAASGRGLVYAVAFGIPLIAVPAYLEVGNRQAIMRRPAITQQQPVMGTAEQQRSQQQIEASVTALARRLQQNPNDGDGWTMLANSYTSLEKYSEAAAAYEKATTLKPNDAGLLVDYAIALAMISNRTLAGKPSELIERALRIDPENPKALQLAGGAAYEAKEYEKAIGYWQRLLAKTPPESDLGQMLSQRIADAKAQR